MSAASSEWWLIGRILRRGKSRASSLPAMGDDALLPMFVARKGRRRRRDAPSPRQYSQPRKGADDGGEPGAERLRRGDDEVAALPPIHHGGPHRGRRSRSARSRPRPSGSWPRWAQLLAPGIDHLEEGAVARVVAEKPVRVAPDTLRVVAGHLDGRQEAPPVEPRRAAAPRRHRRQRPAAMVIGGAAPRGVAPERAVGRRRRCSVAPAFIAM